MTEIIIPAILKNIEILPRSLAPSQSIGAICRERQANIVAIKPRTKYKYMKSKSDCKSEPLSKNMAY